MKRIALCTSDGRWIARDVRLAGWFPKRAFGGLKHLRSHDGLLHAARLGAHTMGLMHAVDIVFLNPQMRVLGLAAAVRPYRVRIAPAGTTRVLQLPTGRIAVSGLKAGTYLIMEPDAETSERRACTQPAPPRAQGAHTLPPPILFSLRLPLTPARTMQDCITRAASRSHCAAASPESASSAGRVPATRPCRSPSESWREHPSPAPACKSP